MSRASKSAEENLAKPEYLDYGVPTERCCGAACNQPQRDNELKLIGVREFNRLLIKTCALTEQQIYCLNVVESEYHLTLVPLK